MKLNKKTATFAIIFSALAISSPLFAVAPPSTPAGSNLDQRLAQRKSEQNITLEEKDVRRLESRCRQAQSKLIAIQQNLVTIVEKRVDKHEMMDAKLWIAIGQLKLAGQDTFELEKQQDIYNNQVNAFNDLTKEYLQSIDDASLMNCAADPTGFSAMLQTSRQYLTEIRSQSDKIRAHMVNNVKPNLSALGEKI